MPPASPTQPVSDSAVINKRVTAVVNLVFGSARTIVAVITGLFLVPLYLRFFGLSLYGAWLASGNVLSLISMAGAGLSGILTQRLSTCYASREDEQFALTAGSGLVLAASIGMVVAAAGSSASYLISSMLGVTGGERIALTWSIVFASCSSGLAILTQCVEALAMAWQRTLVSGFVNLISQAAWVVGIVVPLYFGWGVAALGFGRLMLWAVCFTGMSGYCWYTWRRLGHPRPRVTGAAIRQIWGQAGTLLIGQVAEVMGSRLEALVAALTVSTTASAVLVLTGRVVEAARTFITPVGSAVFAGVAHLSTDIRSENSRRVLREIFAVSAVVSGIGFGLALAFTKPVLLLWIGSQAKPSTLLLALIASSVLLAERKSLLQYVLIAVGRVRDTSRLLIAESLLRVVLLATLAPTLGLVGIPLAACIGAATIVFLMSRAVVQTTEQPIRSVLTPGLAGLSATLIPASLYLALAPLPGSWFVLASFGAIGAMTMLGLSLFDPLWRAALRKVTHALRIALRHRFGRMSSPLADDSSSTVAARN